MNKQKFPAGKLVINFRAGYYPFVIVEQAMNFCCLNIRFFFPAGAQIIRFRCDVSDSLVVTLFSDKVKKQIWIAKKIL
jgi:hypothetical protein